MMRGYLEMKQTSIKDSFDALFEQRQLPSPVAKKRMLQFQIKTPKKKFYLAPILVVGLLFIGAAFFFLTQTPPIPKTATDPQEIIQYSINVNGKSVPFDGKIEVEQDYFSGNNIDVSIVQMEPKDTSRYTEAEKEAAYLSNAVLEHLLPMDPSSWQEYVTDEGLRSGFHYSYSQGKPGDILTFKISDELKERLAMGTNTIEIHIMGVVFPLQGVENQNMKGELERYVAELYTVDNVSFINELKIDGENAYIDFNQAFVDVISPTLSSYSRSELINGLNEIIFTDEKIENIYYFVSSDAQAWSNLFEFTNEFVKRQKTNDFEAAVSFVNEKFYLYDITINDSKSEVIEKLGTDYVEETDPEQSGGWSWKDFSILEYKNLNTVIYFSGNQIVSMTLNNLNEPDVNQFLNSYTGGKFNPEVSTNISAPIRHIYSTESFQLITVKHDPGPNLWLTISSAAPGFIKNMENGIYENSDE